MTALSIQPPYPIFTEADGSPLENGFVYIGTANLDPVANPIAVFWDAALTIPAAQPIRTLNGYPSRNGTPARLYVGSDYSIRVNDSKGVTVYSAPAATERWSNVVVTGADASEVNFLQAGAGAQPRTAQAKLRDVVSVKDFGAVGDGIANDRAAIQAAFNSGAKSVYFPSGTYSVGDFLANGEKAIDLSALGNGISIITDKSVEIIGRTQTGGIPFFFNLKNNNNFYCGPIRFRDTNYNPLATWSGAAAFHLDCDTGVSWGDLVFDAIYAKTMVAGMILNQGSAAGRIRGINIGMLYSDDCYYGFLAKDNGDGVTIERLVAVQNYRPYYVYGCTDHKVNIYNRNNRSTTGAVNIARFAGGPNTSNINVNYVARDMAVNINHVYVNHQDLLGGEISNIRVNVDIRSSVSYTPVKFANFLDSNGTETSAASPNLVYDVSISGSCDAQALPISAVASYGAKRRLNFVQGQNLTLGATVLPLFFLSETVRSAAVTWTASGTNPAIGNGTLVNNYTVIDGVIENNITLTAGSTTTFGSGQWSFSLPYASPVDAVGSAWINDAGTAFFVGTALVFAGASVVNVFTPNSGAGIGAAIPMTWASGDRLVIKLSYSIT